MAFFNHRGYRTGHLWSILLLAFLSWVVLLAGLSSVQDECRSSQEGVSFFKANSLCSSAYRYPWWIVWLALAVFLGVFATALFGTLERGRVALVGFLAFLSVLLVIQTDAFLTAHDQTSSTRITTTFVGFLLTTIFSLALIIVIGTAHAGDIDGAAPVQTTRTGHTTSKV